MLCGAKSESPHETIQNYLLPFLLTLNFLGFVGILVAEMSGFFCHIEIGSIIIQHGDNRRSMLEESKKDPYCYFQSNGNR